MDPANQVQVQDKAVCISHNTNSLSKGMNPTILPPAMDIGLTVIFNFGMATV